MSACTTAALRSSDVEGAEASVLGEDFDYSAYIFLTLTVLTMAPYVLKKRRNNTPLIDLPDLKKMPS